MLMLPEFISCSLAVPSAPIAQNKTMRAMIALLICCGICAAQNARDIVARAVAADDRSDRLARDYTYKIRNEIIEHDDAGRVKSTRSSVDEVLYIAAKR